MSALTRLKILSANIQAGSSTRSYTDYAIRSWSHVLPAGNKRGALDSIAKLVGAYDIVGLQESDPGSLRSGFTNQTNYLADRAGFKFWTHQPNRRIANVASSANALLSKMAPVEIKNYSLPGRIGGRGVLVAKFGEGDEGLAIAVAHLSLGASTRHIQLAYISELLQSQKNAVLMGDFNCTANCPEMQYLFKNTNLQQPENPVSTFPSWRPQRAIDHILVTSSLKYTEMQAIPAASSDHLAISVELDIPESALLRSSSDE